MKIGIVMTIKDRMELTLQSLKDLINSNLKGDIVIVLIDDGSSVDYVRKFLSNLTDKINVIYHERSIGVKQSLIEGIEYCFSRGCGIVTNLDNDVRLKKDWLEVLINHYKVMPNYIHSGFHSVNKNKDGSERHEIVSDHKSFMMKKSVGGINMLFNKTVYEKYIQPALATPEGNWDYIACRNSYLDGHPICVAVPSLIQHTGIHESSLGHNSELPDVAADWYDLYLPDVTLFGLDDRPNNLNVAMEISQRNIKFGDVRILLNHVDGKKGYSEFMINHLWRHFDTSHVLVIQHDGYVINPTAWDNSWLQYDYIGATWGYKDNMNVGNGGFSLRSKRLCKVLKHYKIDNYHPEDHVICRQLRPKLEADGYEFAPEEVANRFSIEAFGVHSFQGANKYTGQFGFHGGKVDFSGWNGHKPYLPSTPTKRSLKISDIWEGMR